MIFFYLLKQAFKNKLIKNVLKDCHYYISKDQDLSVDGNGSVITEFQPTTTDCLTSKIYSK